MVKRESRESSRNAIESEDQGLKRHPKADELTNRQAVGCLPCPVARQVCRVPPAAAEERRVQRRLQGS